MFRSGLVTPAGADSSRWSSCALQDGHDGASAPRTSASNSCPQARHWYSYSGIFSKFTRSAFTRRRLRCTVRRPRIERISMKSSPRTLLVFAALVGIVPAVAHAHFRLLEPTSWIVENERGDPQKTAPCGGTNVDCGKPTYRIPKAVGGSKLHIKVQETVYHPGHYRVSLAVNSPTAPAQEQEATP